MLKQKEKKQEKRQKLIEREKLLLEKAKQLQAVQETAARQKPSALLGQSAQILIDNLPDTQNTRMVEELLKNYPGVDKITHKGKSAVVAFNSADSAKFAVIGLNRFKVDQTGRQLKVSFHTE